MVWIFLLAAEAAQKMISSQGKVNQFEEKMKRFSAESAALALKTTDPE
ncbi:hypothetical protein JW998_15855 [candidate division KSB1 bacterium]|nr:hypothetical protein [candidate division KSB1 bacterium]